MKFSIRTFDFCLLCGFILGAFITILVLNILDNLEKLL
jgi:hypothetical protein